jgi:hypothetical protein
VERLCNKAGQNPLAWCDVYRQLVNSQGVAHNLVTLLPRMGRRVVIALSSLVHTTGKLFTEFPVGGGGVQNSSAEAKILNQTVCGKIGTLLVESDAVSFLLQVLQSEQDSTAIVCIQRILLQVSRASSAVCEAVAHAEGKYHTIEKQLDSVTLPPLAKALCLLLVSAVLVHVPWATEMYV